MVNIHGIGELDLGVPWLEGAAPAAVATRPCSGEAGEGAFLNQALAQGFDRLGGVVGAGRHWPAESA